MTKTGRPSDIDAWREQQYLDLSRRQLHIPKDRITWNMLSEDLQRELNSFPTGYYSGDGSTFETALDELGRTLFIPQTWGNSKFGMCAFGGEMGLYGTAKYGAATYARIIIATAKYDGSGGYGYVKYG